MARPEYYRDSEETAVLWLRNEREGDGWPGVTRDAIVDRRDGKDERSVAGFRMFTIRLADSFRSSGWASPREQSTEDRLLQLAGAAERGDGEGDKKQTDEYGKNDKPTS